jgi:hypothetical protein
LIAIKKMDSEDPPQVTEEQLAMAVELQPEDAPAVQEEQTLPATAPGQNAGVESGPQPEPTDPFATTESIETTNPVESSEPTMPIVNVATNTSESTNDAVVVSDHTAVPAESADPAAPETTEPTEPVATQPLSDSTSENLDSAHVESLNQVEATKLGDTPRSAVAESAALIPSEPSANVSTTTVEQLAEPTQSAQSSEPAPIDPDSSGDIGDLHKQKQELLVKISNINKKTFKIVAPLPEAGLVPQEIASTRLADLLLITEEDV